MGGCGWGGVMVIQAASLYHRIQARVCADPSQIGMHMNQTSWLQTWFIFIVHVTVRYHSYMYTPRLPQVIYEFNHVATSASDYMVEDKGGDLHVHL